MPQKTVKTDKLLEQIVIKKNAYKVRNYGLICFCVESFECQGHRSPLL